MRGPINGQDGVPGDLGFTGSVKVYDDTGALVPAATLGAYILSAKVYDPNSDFVWSTGSATVPSDGVISWSFPGGSFTRLGTDVYRFTLDASQGGQTQRLIDGRLPVVGIASASSDY